MPTLFPLATLRAVNDARDRKDQLLEAGLALSSELSLSALLQRMVDLAAAITGARYGALGVLGPDGRIREFITTGISERRRRLIGHPPSGRGILGVLIREARPLRLRRISDDPRSVGFPPHHPPMSSFLGAPVRALGRVYGNIYLTDKRGEEEFTEEDERALVVLATQAGVAVANAFLYEEARRREAWLEALSEVTGRILAGAEPESTLPLIVARARALAGADTGALATPADGEVLVLRYAEGANAERLRGATLPLRGSVSGEVMRTGQPLVIEDARKDPRVDPRVSRLARMGPTVCVPLKVAGRPAGGVWVSRLAGKPPFEESVVQLLESFADQASVALEYARARRDLERLAVMEERERIARELHDGVIQSLFAVGMGLQGTAMVVGEGEAAQRIEAAIAELDRVIRDLRNYIFGLRPGVLADRQLDQALRELATDFESKSGIAISLDLDPGVAAELTSRATDVLQMAREALANVSRHSGARSARLALERQRRATAVLSVADDGSGFDPARPRPGGQGLRNLRERAQALGGELEVESAPGQGTTIRVRLPLGSG